MGTDWRAWLWGPVSERLADSSSPQLLALWGGAGTRLSAPPDKTLENNMLFPPLPGCARAVFTVGEGGLYYFTEPEPPSLRVAEQATRRRQHPWQPVPTLPLLLLSHGSAQDGCIQTMRLVQGC